jgi:hypothetical protein
MKFLTILETIGKDVLKGVEEILPFARAAEPFVSVANPGAGALLTVTVGVVTEIEQKFAAINKQSGSGPQKLAEALGILEPYILSVFNSKDAAVATNYINAIVAMLNIPAAVKA